MLPENELLLVIFGFMTAFVLAFGIGANDVANSFGTSVGSKVLTLKSACILATIFEVSGSILLGSQVSATIRGGIIDPTQFNATENGAMKLMYGQISSLAGSCIWLLVATFLKIPVSGTHSIVGATAGFGLVLFGLDGVQWMGILKIVISWFVSPLLSGFVSTSMFLIIRKLVLSKENSLEPALYTIPFLYGTCIFINVFTVLFGGLQIFNVPEIPIWITVVVSIAAGILTGIVVFVCGRPIIRKQVLKRIDREKQRELGEFIEDETKPGNGMVRLRNGVVNMFHKMKPSDKTRSGETDTSKDEAEAEKSQRLDRESPCNLEDETKTGDATKRLSIRVDNIYKKMKISVKTSDVELNDSIDSTSLKPTPDDEVCDEQSSSTSMQDAATLKKSTLGSCLVTDDVTETDDTEAQSITITISPAGFAADRPEEAEVFSFAQILTATFGSFVHGGNDVSNAIGPLIGLWLVSTSGDVLNTALPPIWLLFYGGVGISVGLWVWGRKVMQTVGTDLTLITPSSGMCIELGAATTVLIASKIGIPVSTTHCLVGSVVSVGHFRSRSSVNWKLFINIIVAWVVTLPISAGISALLMFTFTRTLPETFG